MVPSSLSGIILTCDLQRKIFLYLLKHQSGDIHLICDIK